MVFSSFLFLFYFLPLALLLFYAVPRKAQHLMLTLVSNRVELEVALAKVGFRFDSARYPTPDVVRARSPLFFLVRKDNVNERIGIASLDEIRWATDERGESDQGSRFDAVSDARALAAGENAGDSPGNEHRTVERCDYGLPGKGNVRAGSLDLGQRSEFRPHDPARVDATQRLEQRSLTVASPPGAARDHAETPVLAREQFEYQAGFPIRPLMQDVAGMRAGLHARPSRVRCSRTAAAPRRSTSSPASP